MKNKYLLLVFLFFAIPKTYSQAIAITSSNITVCNGRSIELVTNEPTLTPYQYEWSLLNIGTATYERIVPAQTTKIITNIPSGSYRVKIIDVPNGTEIERDFVVEDLLITEVVSDYFDHGFAVSGFGLSTGNIGITITGGKPSVVVGSEYTFLWAATNGGDVTGKETGKDLTGVPAGDYQLQVTDSNGCQQFGTWTLASPPDLVISEDVGERRNVPCFQNPGGQIKIDIAQNSLAPYTFTLTEISTGVTQQRINQPGSFTFTGIPAGTYNATVTDENLISKQLLNIPIATTVSDLRISNQNLSNFNGFNVTCRGAVNGTITITAAGGSANYTYLWEVASANARIPIGQGTTARLTNIGAGSYKVTLRDGSACNFISTYQITEPLAVTPNPIKSDYNTFEISGFGLSNGTLNANVTGGTGNYTYNWQVVANILHTGQIPALQQGQQTLTGLLPGTYAVTATDSNGCSSPPVETILTQPNELLIAEDLPHVNVLCFGETTGIIKIDITQESVPPYTMTLTNEITNTVIQNFDNVIIPAPVPPANRPYQFTGLSAGTYTAKVTDANGNIKELPGITITQPVAGIQVSNVILSQETNLLNIKCNGDLTGSISFNVTGGTPGIFGAQQYQYSWKKNTVLITDPFAFNNLTGLGAGNYEVTITDDAACAITQTFTLTEPPVLSITPVLSGYNGFGISGFGEDNGFINITPAGGNPPYTYQWSTVGGQIPAGQINRQNLSTLTAGAYSVTVTDSQGCFQLFGLADIPILTEPNALLIQEDLAARINVACFGATTGEIKIDILTGINGLGSVTPYTYTLTDGFTGAVITGATNTALLSHTFTGLLSSSYTATVTDANNNSITTPGILIDGPISGITITSETISNFNGFEISCNGAPTGDINILAVTSGVTGLNPLIVPTHTYSWRSISGRFLTLAERSLPQLLLLTPGDYELTITNSRNCTLVKTYTIAEPPILSLTSEVSNYNGFNISGNGLSDGIIDVAVTGGVSLTPYTYLWTNDNGDALTLPPPFQDNVLDQANLPAGSYKLTVTDNNNCFVELIKILTEPNALLIQEDIAARIDVACVGGTTGVIKIDITQVNGVGSVTDYDYTLTDFLTNAVITGATNTALLSHTFTGLTTGTYIAAVTDANGNTATTTQITITEPVSALAITSETFLNVIGNGYGISCNGAADGAIAITASGGTVIPPATYTYSWTGPAGYVANTNNITFLIPGAYTVTITDATAQCPLVKTYTITEPPALNLTSVVSNNNGFAISGNGLSDGTIDITVRGGVPGAPIPYTYAWSTVGGQIPAGQINRQNLSTLTAGAYSVTVTDATNCSTFFGPITLNQPNALTINEDLGSHVDVLCFGTTTGEIKIDIDNAFNGLGSVTPYTYTLTNVNTNATITGATNSALLSHTFTGLTASAYTATVTDANGNTFTTTPITILGPANGISIATEITSNIFCNGANNGAINITAAGGTQGVPPAPDYTYLWVASGGGVVNAAQAVSNNLTGLSAGVYTVTINDATGVCPLIKIYTITEPPALSLIIDTVSNYNGFEISGFGESDGNIAITVSGGAPGAIIPYTYSWTINGNPLPPAQAIQEDQTNLSPGDYSVTATDSNGCFVTSRLITLNEPNLLTINEDPGSHVDVLCFGGTTGEIKIDIDNAFNGLGSVTPYTYTLTNVNTNATITGATNSALLSHTFTGLTASAYTATVTDANGNTFTTTPITILGPANGISIATEITSNIFCNGANNGAINITAAGGTQGVPPAPDYTYLWVASGGGVVNAAQAVSNNLTGLSAGVYTVTINDATGVCPLIKIYTITEPPALSLIIDTVSNYNGFEISGFGESDGNIAITVSGGAPGAIIPYTYSWTINGNPLPPAQAIQEDQTNLSPGDYSVTATDSNGCFVTSRLITLNEPNLLTINEDPGSHVDVLCFGGTTGEIKIDIGAFGSVAPYTYTLTDVLTNTTITGKTNTADLTDTFTGLTASTYNATVTDANGNTATTTPITITGPANGISVTETIIQYNTFQISCNGDNNGSIAIIASGGTQGVFPQPLYTYNWSTSNGRTLTLAERTQTTLSNLSPGDYTVTIRDAVGCPLVKTYTITEPPALSLTPTVSNNNGFAISGFGESDGTISIIVSGGAPFPAPQTYTYRWTDDNGLPLTLPPPFQSTLQNQTNLPPGGYSVTATDNNGCTISSGPITLNEPNLLTITEDLGSHVEVLCFGATTGEIKIDIGALGSVAPYTYTLTDVLTNTTITGKTNTADLTDTFTGLTASTYNATVTDANGNTATTTPITITGPANGISVTETIIQYNTFQISCNGAADGAIAITASGGTPGGYTYNWSTLNGRTLTLAQSTQTILSNLSPGDYTVTIRDAVGCPLVQTYTITEPPAFSLTLAAVSNYNGFEISGNGLSDGTIDITVTGGVPGAPIPYTYVWSTTGGLIPAGQTTRQNLTNLTAGAYSVTVTDNNNCPITLGPITLNEPNLLSITEHGPSHVQVLCFGGTTGEIRIDIGALGSVPPYRFTLTNHLSGVVVEDITGSALLSYTFDNLTASIYNATVTDNNGNTASVGLIPITQPANGIAITNENISNFNSFQISCNGAADGAIAFDVTGGTTRPLPATAYTYAWFASNGGVLSAAQTTSQNLTGLVAGDYTVTINDVTGLCPLIRRYTITEPGTISLTAATSNYNGFEISGFGLTDGSITATVTGGATPYNYFLEDTAGTTLSSGFNQTNLQFDFLNLGIGIYRTRVTDANGCSTTSLLQTLTSPQALVISQITADLVCFGDPSGSIEITIDGGGTVPNYTFNLTDNVTGIAVLPSVTTNSTSHKFENLLAGVYNAIVTDANTITTTITSIIVNEPTAPITISNEVISNFNTFQTSCNGAADGAIGFTVTGGTPGALPAPAYTFVWVPSNGGVLTVAQTTLKDLTGLVAGTYTVTISDATNSCTLVRAYTILEPTTLTLTTNAPSPFNGSQISGFGLQDGSIDITVGGGTAPYEFALKNLTTGLVVEQVNTQTSLTYTFNGYGADDYEVTITDANLCSTVSLPITLTQPPNLLISETHQEVFCFGQNTGSIVISIDGGGTVPGYTFTLTDNVTGNPIFGQPVISQNGLLHTFSDLFAGAYDVTVSDANLISKVIRSIIIIEPTNGIAITNEVISNFNGTNIRCNGDNNGEINISVGGGNPAQIVGSEYTFLWEGPLGYTATTEDIASLAPGSYKVTITDSSLCEFVKTYTITEPEALSIAAVPSNYNGFQISAFGLNDGSIDVVAFDGAPPYKYTVENNLGQIISEANTQTSNFVFTNLIAGRYIITTIDSNGCTVSDQILMNEPQKLLISATAQNILCFGEGNGSIEIIVLRGGSVPNYTYVLTDNATGLVVDQISNINDLSFRFNNLQAGNYKATVTDLNLDSTVIASIIINEPASGIEITDTFIPDYNTFQISCNGASDGAINITVSGGNPRALPAAAYAYSWTGPLGYTATTEDINALAPGAYTVTITDSASCTFDALYTITEPEILTITAVSSDYSGFQISSFGLNDGSIQIIPVGGASPFTFALTNLRTAVVVEQLNNQTNAGYTFSGLAADAYELTITDANGCIATPLQTTLTEPQELLISETNQDISCFGDNTGSIEISIAGLGSAPNYTFTLKDALSGSLIEEVLNQSSLSYTFNNLTASAYTASVTDANGSSKTIVGITISEPAEAITIDDTETNIPCFGLNNGSITATVSGGQIPYTYAWLASGGGIVPSGQTNQDNLSNLNPGVYQFTVTDFNGCTLSKQWTITEPLAIDLTTVTSDYNGYGISGFGLNDGNIAVTVTGGVSPYTYVLKDSTGATFDQANNQTSLQYDFINLVADTYEITVTDRNGCSATPLSITLEQPQDLLISETNQDINCFGDRTGSIEISILGGGTVPNYNFTLTKVLSGTVVEDVLGQNSLSYIFNNLEAGAYTAAVTDANGIVKTIVGITISEPAEAITIDDTETNITCFGLNNGSITATVSGGQIPYTYAWSASGGGIVPSGQINQDNLSNLNPGVYQFTVTDFNGCTLSKQWTITEPLALNLTAVTSDYNGFEISGFGLNDGDIAVTITGGSLPYVYSWSATNGGIIPSGQQAQKDLFGLIAGDYQVIITDDNGCFVTENWTLDQPQDLVILEKISSHENVLCFGDNTGIIEINIVGGDSVPNYTFTLINEQTRAVTQQITNLNASNFTFTALPAGSYEATVTDTNGNSMTLTSLLVSGPASSLEISDEDISDYNGFQISRIGSNDGSINLTVSGGVQSYSYQWVAYGGGMIPSGQTNLKDLFGLRPGIYNVTITDRNRCEISKQWTIAEPDGLFISEKISSHENVECFGDDDGIIEISINQGSVTPYKYVLVDVVTGLITQEKANENGNSYTFTGIPAGIYDVIVTDANGTNKRVSSINISGPTEILIDDTKTDITCVGSNDGSIAVNITGGTTPYRYSWTATNGGVLSPTQTNIPVLVGLVPGDYELTITDFKGCPVSKNWTIIGTTPIQISFIEEDIIIDCDLASATKQIVPNVSGGREPYTYRWSDGAISGVNGEILTASITNTYTLTVIDKQGCEEIATLPITIPTFDSTDFEYTSLGLTEYNFLSVKDPIQFTNLSNITDATIWWDFGDRSPLVYEENPIYTFKTIGAYDVTLYVEYATGCIEQSTVNLDITEGYVLESPTAFTPNDDGYNDTLLPKFAGFKEIEMSIYNNWGTRIYYEKDLELKGWDGNLQSSPATNGDYIMVITGTTFYDQEIIKTTSITLLK